MDVLEHLTKEHREVEAMLEQLATSKDGNRESLLEQLEVALETHMLVEEQFLYPIVDDVLGVEKTEGAENEHDLVREGLARMQDLTESGGFGAALEMVKAGIQHHVREEEQQIFPQLRARAGDQLAALGDPEQLAGQLVDDDEVEDGEDD